MRRYIHIYIDYVIYRKFTSLCRFLGINVCDTLESLLKRFIEEHKDQAPLDFYLAEKDGKTQIINFNFTQNNYNIILARIAKLDPEKWLGDLETLDPDTLNDRQAEFWKEKLPELILEASKTIEELKAAGEYDYIETLQDLINKASEILKRLLKKKKTRRELIHA